MMTCYSLFKMFFSIVNLLLSWIDFFAWPIFFRSCWLTDQKKDPLKTFKNCFFLNDKSFDSLVCFENLMTISKSFVAMINLLFEGFHVCSWPSFGFFDWFAASAFPLSENEGYFLGVWFFLVGKLLFRVRPRINEW